MMNTSGKCLTVSVALVFYVVIFSYLWQVPLWDVHSMEVWYQLETKKTLDFMVGQLRHQKSFLAHWPSLLQRPLSIKPYPYYLRRSENNFSLFLYVWGTHCAPVGYLWSF